MTNFSIAWLNGISALLLIFVAFFLVIDSAHYYIKLHNNTYLGGILLFSSIGIGWTGITLSFLTLEFTAISQPWVQIAIPFFSYGTLPVGSFAIAYIVWDLVGSKKSKKIILLIYILFGIAYYIIFFLELPFHSVLFNYETGVTGSLLDDYASPYTFFYYFIWIFIIVTSTITLIGFGKMMQKTAGELKTRSALLMISSPIFSLCILLDTVILGSLIHDYYNYLYIVRLMMMLSLLLIMIAFRPTSIKPTLLVIPILIIIFIVFLFFIGTDIGV